jgi:hypothetical protein
VHRSTWAYVTGLFVVHAAVGLYALAADFRGPYSDGEAIAAEIRSRHLEGLPLLGVALVDAGTFSWDIDDLQPVLLGLDAGRAYDPVDRSFEPFWRHYDDAGSHFTWAPQERLTGELSSIARDLHSPLLVVRVTPGREAVVPMPASLETLLVPPPPLDFGERLSLHLFPVTAR